MDNNQKQGMPRFPMSYPPNLRPTNTPFMQNYQMNAYAQNGMLLPPPPPRFAFPNMQIMNPRIFQHYMNSMKVFPVPPNIPTPANNRNPQFRVPTKEIGKNSFEMPQKSKVIPNLSQSKPKIKPQNIFLSVSADSEERKNKKNKNYITEEKKHLESKNPILFSSEIDRQKTLFLKQKAELQKQKQAKRALMAQYQPQKPSKKFKKDLIFQELEIEPIGRNTRSTRDKKDNIEKIMIQIMKNKPHRERIIKIGKQHQAIVPESYINEYEYQLKLKMEKKQSLMQRFVPTA